MTIAVASKVAVGIALGADYAGAFTGCVAMPALRAVGFEHGRTLYVVALSRNGRSPRWLGFGVKRRSERRQRTLDRIYL